MPTIRPHVLRACALAALLLPAARAARAQAASDAPLRTVTVQVGGLTHDFYGDAVAPMAALRAGWTLRPWLLSELGAIYARPEYTEEQTVHVTGVDLGLQAQATLGVLRPYAGLALGIHGTFEPAGGDRYFGPSTQAVAGIRLMVSRRALLRGELRYRLDAHQSGAHADNMETTIGLGWAY